MSLEDDLKTTAESIRGDFTKEETRRKACRTAWETARANVVVMKFRSAKTILKGLGWVCDDNLPNGSAKLSLGERPTVEGPDITRYLLTLKPDLTTCEVVAEFGNMGDPSKNTVIERLDPAKLKDSDVDRIITRFLKLSEEDRCERALPT